MSDGNIVGTLTTKHGLVHAVDWVSSTLVFVGVEWEEWQKEHPDDVPACTTVCRRRYEKTPLDVPRKVVTCMWCATGQRWPQK